VRGAERASVFVGTPGVDMTRCFERYTIGRMPTDESQVTEARGS